MTRPRNEPAIAATLLTPSAMPRWLSGNASVRIAVEFAISIAAADALHHPPADQPQRAADRSNGSSDSATDAAVKTTKPRLYIRTRPYMSPSRPKATTSTAVTTR